MSIAGATCALCAIVACGSIRMAAPHLPAAIDGAQPASQAAPEGPALVLPRACFVWKTDAFGQVIGDTAACPPLAARIKSIAPAAPLPGALSAKEGPSSLRIAGTTSSGLSRDIAALQWAGPIITWQRLPVPAAAFEQSLKGLAAWMMNNTFAVTLEDGRVVQVGTESQRLSVELSTSEGATAAVGIADVPKGMRLLVPKAVPAPAQGSLGEGPFLMEISRSDRSVRVATHPDTLVDIEVSEVPAQVRVSAATPSGARVARAEAEIATTDELLTGAPPDQRRILEAQRASQQAELDELRKIAASERIRATVEPIVACLVDPRSGREYATISISLKDAAGGGDASQGQRTRDAARGAARQGRGAP